MSPSIVLRNARLLGGDDLVDISVVEGRVAALSPAGEVDHGRVEALDLDARIVTPGLWDEHLHFTQWTTTRSRLDLAGTTSADDVLRRVRDELARAGRAETEFLTGYGYRDGTWSSPTTLRALDEVAGDTPVVLINGDLHSAWLNGAAASRVGVDLDETGVVSESRWFDASQRVAAALPPTTAMFREAAEAAARRGIVGVVEFENADNLAHWPDRVAAGVDAVRVEASVWPVRLDDAIARGLRTGDRLDPTGLVTMGRLKVVVDGSLNTRTALCWEPYPGAQHDGAGHGHGVATVTPAELRTLLTRASSAGIDASVHAIGDRANSEVVDVFADLGLGGVIEHAQLVRADDFARFAELGLVASVQPEHAMDDRDVADRHWHGRTDRAFAFGSLHEAGVTLRFGSDAPVAVLDPWVAISAATSRSRDGRVPWHPEQRVPLDVALAASMRGRIRPVVGDIADLAVLDADPYRLTADELREMPVAATLLGGRFTWNAL
ncbi:amidohydrolase [Frigoribacterium sp. 2-23]|uniref:amidohydrolase n=1 Tax=Frigoribacterium sp. 2-23 TaxID=3415006 RepID=UPI003C6F9809